MIMVKCLIVFRRTLFYVGVHVFVLASNMTSPAHAETATYSYDALGRLKTVVWSSGRTVTYSYDANGNRTVKVVS